MSIKKLDDETIRKIAAGEVSFLIHHVGYKSSFKRYKRNIRKFNRCWR